MWRTGLVAPQHVGSSQTRAQTRVPCIGRQILNHCTTREALYYLLNVSRPCPSSLQPRLCLSPHPAWCGLGQLLPPILSASSFPLKSTPACPPVVLLGSAFARFFPHEKFPQWLLSNKAESPVLSGSEKPLVVRPCHPLPVSPTLPTRLPGLRTVSVCGGCHVCLRRGCSLCGECSAFL